MMLPCVCTGGGPTARRAPDARNVNKKQNVLKAAAATNQEDDDNRHMTQEIPNITLSA